MMIPPWERWGSIPELLGTKLSDELLLTTVTKLNPAQLSDMTVHDLRKYKEHQDTEPRNLVGFFVKVFETIPCVEIKHTRPPFSARRNNPQSDKCRWQNG